MTPILSNERLYDADFQYIDNETGDIYVCNCDNRKLDELNLTDEQKEDYPCWSICRLRQSKDAQDNQYIRRTYPNGKKLYQFKITDMFKYEYKYAE